MIAAESITIDHADAWLTAVYRRVDLDGVAALQLLATDCGPGNARNVRRADGVHCVVDLPCTDVEVEELTERIGALAGRCSDAPAQSVDEEELETVLSEIGLEWARREDRWVIPAGADRPDLTIEIVDGGARVTSRLLVLDDTSSEARHAIAEFLIRARDSVRFARFEITGDEVVAASCASTTRLEVELPHCLKALASAWRLVAPEVRALADIGLARRYLDFLGEEDH